jgi:hypothetical protein
VLPDNWPGRFVELLDNLSLLKPLEGGAPVSAETTAKIARTVNKFLTHHSLIANVPILPPDGMHAGECSAIRWHPDAAERADEREPADDAIW